MMKRILIFLIVILALVYCGLGIYFYKKSFREKIITETPKIIAPYNSSDLVVLKESFYDFDDGSWKNKQELTDKKSYSGKNSVRISPQTEYAGEIIQSFSEIPSLNNLREVEVTLKIWHETLLGEGTVWVLEVDDENGKSLDWFPGDLSTRLQNWETQTFRFKIKPDYLKNFNRIKTYAWNQTKSSCYIDDIRIRYYGIPSENISNDFNSLKQSTFLFDLENDSSLLKTGSLTEELSHSGKHSSLMDGKNEYSVLIGKKISDIMNDTITSLTASVWLYPLIDHPECTLVFEAKNSDDDQLFLYEKNTTKMSLKSGSWQKLNASFALAPEDYRKLGPDDIIYVYVKNNCRAKIYADDFEISYGNVPDRRGKQTFVDMNSLNTRSYQLNRYHPPFPISHLNIKNINNDNSSFLIKRDSGYSGNLRPDQFMSTGNFTGQSSGRDELLVVSEKEIEFYYFCENKSSFIFSGAASFDKNKFPNAVYSVGDFNGDGKHELIITSGKISNMYDFDVAHKQRCVDNNGGVSMISIWTGVLSNESSKLFVGKFSNEKSDELFSVERNGHCTVKRFLDHSWIELANDTVSPSIFGNQSTQVVGRFRYSRDEVLLTVYRENNQTHSSTLEVAGNKINRKLIPDAELSDDLFKWDDVLFRIPSKGINIDDILALNHQWRFELNYIASDERGFYVSSTPAFTGYPTDHNPKYYEFPKFVTGKFTGNDTELLCILYNCADSNFNGTFCKKYDSVPDLPNSIQLYTFSK